MHPGFTIQAPKVCKAAAPSCPLHALSRPSPLLPLNRKPILVTTRACILPPEPCPSYCPYNPTSYLQPYKFPLRLLIRLKNRTRCRSRTLTGTRASTLTGGFRPYRRYAASLGRVSQALRSSPPQESAFCEYLKGRHCIDQLHRPIASTHCSIASTQIKHPRVPHRRRQLLRLHGIRVLRHAAHKHPKPATDPDEKKCTRAPRHRADSSTRVCRGDAWQMLLSVNDRSQHHLCFNLQISLETAQLIAWRWLHDE